jgi:hypothetical protein
MKTAQLEEFANKNVFSLSPKDIQLAGGWGWWGGGVGISTPVFGN